MKKILLIAFLFMTFACQEHTIGPESGNAACNVSNPVNDLPWLKTLIAKSSESQTTDFCTVSTIVQGVYNGETVFIPMLGGALCCPCGNAVYNCSGELVFICDLEKEAKIVSKKIIWQQD